MADERPRCILVVDDSVSNRDAIAELLRDEGFRALTAADAAQAEAALAADAVELVLLDVGLPKVSGLELLERVRRARSPMELPIIMVTAASESDAVVAALARGANDYVTKPVDFAVLLARVRTQLELGRLSRLKDQFLRIASHDLKNPLTAIHFGVDSLADEFPPGATMTAEGAHYVDVIRQAASKMLRIVRDFLDLGALRDGHLALDVAPLDLRALAGRSVEGCSIYAHGKSIRLELVPGAPQPVRVDGARVTQVIDNLLSNAIKFTPPGGRVAVSLAGGDGLVRLEVRDSGPGLADGDFAKLFVAHARASSRPTAGESSTGLGLALARQLVELHGGRIGARNGDDGGAVFWFELPTVARAAATG